MQSVTTQLDHLIVHAKMDLQEVGLNAKVCVLKSGYDTPRLKECVCVCVCVCVCDRESEKVRQRQPERESEKKRETAKERDWVWAR